MKKNGLSDILVGTSIINGLNRHSCIMIIVVRYLE